MIRPAKVLSYFSAFLAISFGAKSAHAFENYELARRSFRGLSEQVKEIYPEASTEAHYVPSRIDNDLTIDSLYIPAQKTSVGLVVVSSGVHGAEAPTGAAIQKFLLQQTRSKKISVDNLGFLYVHAINPYGYKYGRRVTENNVDLNRNFDISPEIFEAKNPQYEKLKEVLNPSKPVSNGWFTHMRFLTKILKARLNTSSNDLSQAIGQGQYQFPKGIMFGGKDFEPQRKVLEKLLLEKSKDYSAVFILDLHTGYGRKAALQLLPNPADSKEIAKRWQKVFKGYKIESTGQDNFYSNAGDFSTYASRLLEKQGKKTVPMLVEFGTLDSHKIKGSLTTLTRLVLENQWFWNRGANELDTAKIRRNFWEMFTPPDSSWRAKVMEQSKKEIPRFINNFEELASSDL